jgi:hypothetical protein
MYFFTNIVEKTKNLLNSDKKHKIYFIGECIIEIFRIVMASSFLVSTPQKCYKSINCVNDYTELPHICSTEENLSCFDGYQKFALYFNLLTILCFGMLYIVEIKRDEWLLMNFDYTRDSNETNLELYRDDFNYLFRTLLSYNKYYYMSYQMLIFIYLLNVIFSGVIIFGVKYYDINTASAFLTAIFLCFNKIITGLYLSKLSLEKNLPISYYNRINLCFNDIDYDIKDNLYSKVNEYKKRIDKEFENNIKINSYLKKNDDIINNDAQPNNYIYNIDPISRELGERSVLEINEHGRTSVLEINEHRRTSVSRSDTKTGEELPKNLYLIDHEINLRRNSNKFLRRNSKNSNSSEYLWGLTPERRGDSQSELSTTCQKTKNEVIYNSPNPHVMPKSEGLSILIPLNETNLLNNSNQLLNNSNKSFNNNVTFNNSNHSKTSDNISRLNKKSPEKFYSYHINLENDLESATPSVNESKIQSNQEQSTRRRSSSLLDKEELKKSMGLAFDKILI